MLSNEPLRIQVQHLDRWSAFSYAFAIYFGDMFIKVNQATLSESSALFFSYTCPIIAHGHPGEETVYRVRVVASGTRRHVPA